MGEKRFFEGWVAGTEEYRETHLMGAEGVLLGIVLMSDLFEGLEHKRVRVTVEVLDDDHLEMDKLERQ